MAKRYYGSDVYSGREGKMRMEQEGQMIKEDRSKIANLPQEVKMMEYPKPEYYHYDLDDTIKGVDNQMNDDVRSGKGQSKANEKYPEKW